MFWTVSSDLISILFWKTTSIFTSWLTTNRLECLVFVRFYLILGMGEGERSCNGLFELYWFIHFGLDVRDTVCRLKMFFPNINLSSVYFQTFRESPKNKNHWQQLRLRKGSFKFFQIEVIVISKFYSTFW